MAGSIHNVTVLSALSIAGGTSAGTVALNAAPLSLGTFSFSMTTAADASGIADGALGLIQRASGWSLVYKSGSTVYTVGTSAVSGTA
jgi:hypothetical protein